MKKNPWSSKIFVAVAVFSTIAPQLAYAECDYAYKHADIQANSHAIHISHVGTGVGTAAMVASGVTGMIAQTVHDGNNGAAQGAQIGFFTGAAIFMAAAAWGDAHQEGDHHMAWRSKYHFIRQALANKDSAIEDLRKKSLSN
jgi:hypothetical protein